MKRSLVFCHGWGFDKDYWETIKPYFYGEDCYFWDLGYFGSRKLTLPPSDRKIIGIGHSFGMLQLMQFLSHLDMVVGLQGFTNFLGYSPTLHTKRALELRAVKTGFKHNPQAALSQFYQRGGVIYPRKQEIDKNRLYSDLEALSKKHLFPQCPTLILASKDDIVAPPALIEDNFQDMRNVSVIYNARGNHALGFMKAEWVAKHIWSFINAN